MDIAYNNNAEKWIYGIEIEQFIGLIWNEIIYGGHLFAMGSLSVVSMCAILFRIPVTLDFLILVYLIFYPIYLYDYSKCACDDRLTNSKRADYLDGKNGINFVVFASFLMLGIISIHFSNFETMCLSFTVLLAGLLYSSYFKQLTRQIIAFKNIYVSLVWALMVLFSFYYYSYPLTTAALFIATFVFIRMWSIQILFDIRDVEGDKKEGLLTIPVVMGNGKDLEIIKYMNVFTMLLIIYGSYFNIIPQISIAFLPVIFYSSYYIEKVRISKKDNSGYLFAAGEPITWLVLIYLGNFLDFAVVTISNTL